MEKYIKDGKVAVLYHPHYGGGWSAWAKPKDAVILAMDADIVRARIEGNYELFKNTVEKKVPNYTLKVDPALYARLQVKWLEVGTVFEITDHEGFESFKICYNDVMIA